MCMQSFNINCVVEQIKEYILDKASYSEEEQYKNYELFNNTMNDLLVRDVVKIAEIYNKDCIKSDIKFDSSKFN